MSIRFYEIGEHPAGFYGGYRVAVMVDGKHRQKYFSIKNQSQQHAKKQAEKLNQEWQFEQKIYQEHAKREAKERRRSSSAYTTGVSGIKMKYAITKRKGVKIHFLPIFMVQGTENKKPFAKYFSIKRYGFNYAWFKAVEYYKQKKGINSDKLITRQPNIEQFIVINRYLKSRFGYDVPASAMPEEFKEVYQYEHEIYANK